MEHTSRSEPQTRSITMHRCRAHLPLFASLAAVLFLGLSPAPASAQASRTGTSLAQRLVDSAQASHPEADEIGILAETSRGCYGIASTDKSDVGERCEAEDIVPMKTGKPSVEREGSGFDVSVLLHDAAGNTVGVLAVGFEGGAGMTEASARKTVESIEARMATSIPSKAKLLEGAQP